MNLHARIVVNFGMLLIASSLVSLSVVFDLMERLSRLNGGEEIQMLVNTAMNEYRTLHGENVDDGIGRKAIVEVNRILAESSIAKRELVLDTVGLFVLFLFAQFLVLVLLAFLIARILAGPLGILVDGIRTAGSREHGYRLAPLSGREFSRIGEEFNLLLRDLDEKEALLREHSKLAGWQEVASFLSHQLKNPLTSIVLAGQNIVLQGASVPIRHSIDLILSQSARIVALVNRFRSSTSLREPHFAEVDLAELVKRAIYRFDPHHVRFVVDLEPELSVQLDLELMEEALVNLFTNSVEAMDAFPGSDDKGVELKHRVITVQSHRIQGSVDLRVSDSVKGLPPEIAEKVLHTPFSDKPGGTGLGLVFVRTVVNVHQGSIGATMSEFGGLVFCIRLPLRNGSWQRS